MIRKEQRLDSTAIQAFLAGSRYFEYFCFYLSQKLRSAYAYANLPQHNRSAASIALLEIAAANAEVGEVIYQLFCFWEDAKLGLKAVYRSELVNLLISYLYQLEDEHKVAEAQDIRHLLSRQGLQNFLPHSATYCADIMLPKDLQIGKAFEIQICFYPQGIEFRQWPPLVENIPMEIVETISFELQFGTYGQVGQKAYLQIDAGADDIFILRNSSRLHVHLRPSEVVSIILLAWPLAHGDKRLRFKLYQEQQCIASASRAIQVSTPQKQQRESLEMLLTLIKAFPSDWLQDLQPAHNATVAEPESPIDSPQIALLSLGTVSESSQVSALTEGIKWLLSMRTITEVRLQDNALPAYIDLFNQSLQEIQQVLLPELCAVTQMPVASSYEAQIADIMVFRHQAITEHDDFVWAKAIQKLQVLKDRLLTTIAREKLHRRIQ